MPWNADGQRVLEVAKMAITVRLLIRKVAVLSQWGIGSGICNLESSQSIFWSENNPVMD